MVANISRVEGAVWVNTLIAASQRNAQYDQQQLSNDRLDEIKASQRASVKSLNAQNTALRELRQETNHTNELLSEQFGANERHWKNQEHYQFSMWKTTEDGRRYLRWRTAARSLVAVIESFTDDIANARAHDLYDESNNRAANDPIMRYLNTHEAYEPYSKPGPKIASYYIVWLLLKWIAVASTVFWGITFFVATIDQQLLHHPYGTMNFIIVVTSILVSLAVLMFALYLLEKAKNAEAKWKEQKAEWEKSHFPSHSPEEMISQRYQAIINEVNNELPDPTEWTKSDIKSFVQQVNHVIENEESLLPTLEEIPSIHTLPSLINVDALPESVPHIKQVILEARDWMR